MEFFFFLLWPNDVSCSVVFRLHINIWWWGTFAQHLNLKGWQIALCECLLPVCLQFTCYFISAACCPTIFKTFSEPSMFKRLHNNRRLGNNSLHFFYNVSVIRFALSVGRSLGRSLYIYAVWFQNNLWHFPYSMRQITYYHSSSSFMLNQHTSAIRPPHTHTHTKLARAWSYARAVVPPELGTFSCVDSVRPINMQVMCDWIIMLNNNATDAKLKRISYEFRNE